VGGVLGFGLAKSGGNLKTAITVVGAALGGAPVLFIEGVGQAKWAYPVGLVLGLLILRLQSIRLILESGRTGSSRKRSAWIEIVVIVGFSIAIIVWTSIPE
jgi:fermentation-respiration switch protein FrsA (DUF1100 family)